jgi:ankyrin repeat protein
MDKLSRDELYELATFLELDDILVLCSDSRINRLLCANKQIWLYKINQHFPPIPLEIMERYKGNSWKRYYMDLEKYIGMDPALILINGVKLNRLDLVMIGVNLGADTNNYFGEYFKPLPQASASGYLEIVEYLVEHGVHDGTNDLQLSLQWASGSGQLEVVKYLSQILTNQGNDITNWGTEAIKNAIRARNLSIVEYLLENGADPQDSIIVASKYGEYEIVKYLIDRNLYARNDLNIALHWASRGDLPTVKYLVEHGANPRHDNDKALLSSISGGNLEVVKYLVEHGARVNTRRNTPIYMASKLGDLPIVKYLVENGADISVDNYNIIREAKHFEHWEVVKYLEKLRQNGK